MGRKHTHTAVVVVPILFFCLPSALKVLHVRTYFVFVFLLFLFKAQPFIEESFFGMHAPPTASLSYLTTTVCVLFYFCFFFVSLEMSLFPRILSHHYCRFLFIMLRVRRSFFLPADDGVFSTLSGTRDGFFASAYNVVVVVVFFTLTDRASTISSNIHTYILRGCQSGTWSQRDTKVNRSHRGDNPLLRPTGIQIATKSYFMRPYKRWHRPIISKRLIKPPLLHIKM